MHVLVAMLVSLLLGSCTTSKDNQAEKRRQELQYLQQTKKNDASGAQQQTEHGKKNGEQNGTQQQTKKNDVSGAQQQTEHGKKNGEQNGTQQQTAQSDADDAQQQTTTPANCADSTWCKCEQLLTEPETRGCVDAAHHTVYKSYRYKRSACISLLVGIYSDRQARKHMEKITPNVNCDVAEDGKFDTAKSFMISMA